MDYDSIIDTHSRYYAQRVVLTIRTHLRTILSEESTERWIAGEKGVVRVPDLLYFTDRVKYISKREISRLVFEILHVENNFVHIFHDETYFTSFRNRYLLGPLELVYCIQYSDIIRKHECNKEQFYLLSIFLANMYCEGIVKEYIGLNRGLMQMDYSLPDPQLLSGIINPILSKLSGENMGLLSSTIMRISK